MPSAVQSIECFEDAVRDFETFDTTVLIRTGGRIRHLRIGKFQQAFAVWARKTDTVSDLKSAFAAVLAQWTEGDLLIDSVTVQTSFLEFRQRDDDLVKVATAAWMNGLANYNVVGKKLAGCNNETITAFTEEVKRLSEFQANVFVKIGPELKELEISSTLSAPDSGQGIYGAALRHLDLYLRDCPNGSSGTRHYTGDAVTARAVVDYYLDGGQILFDTLIVRGDKVKLKTDSTTFKRALEFLAGGVKPLDTESDINADRVRSAAITEAVYSYLTLGEPGISIFNGIAEQMKLVANLVQRDFSGQKLNGLQICSLNFDTCCFDSCQLKKMQAERSNFSDCTFEKADLSGGSFIHVVAAGSNFSGANLSKCKFHNCDLSNVNLAGADVSGTDFKSSDLRGVDLSICNATQAKSFAKALYDEHTVIPEKNFESLWKQLVWIGDGPDPYRMMMLQKQKEEIKLQLDFNSFMELIGKDYDQARVSKAVSMLKASRFELFCEQNSAGVVGIVQSQTDSELAYACRLGVDGTFACCTQNLNPCGGLRGALCKHILVLVIGLAKAGELDLNEAAHRIIASKTQTPSLNRDAMASVFLQYHGAQSGSFDWRPTETMPEDYYTF